jgi:hypothetical protein
MSTMSINFTRTEQNGATGNSKCTFLEKIFLFLLKWHTLREPGILVGPPSMNNVSYRSSQCAVQLG